MLLSFVVAVIFLDGPAVAGLFNHRHTVAKRVFASTPTSSVAGILRTVNAERARGRVPALALDARTSGVAQAYASDMARRGFFGHVSPEGVDPFTRMHRVGLVFHAAGENIGLGSDLAGAERAIYGDAAHRAIVLGPRFRHIGLGFARTRTDVILVEDFTD